MHRAQRDIEDRDDDTSRGKDPGQPPDQDQAYEAEFFRLFGLTSLLSLDTPATSSRPSPTPSTLPSTHLPSVDVEAENRALPSFCASPSQVLHSLEQLEAESDEEYFQFESGGLKSNVFHFPKGYDQQGNQWMTITDITGVHSLPVHFCSCSIAKRPYLQLLELGIYPVTYDRPQSAFTFRLLDDFDIDNLETKSSAQSYYEKLRRLTSNTYPYLVPDRYREFMTCARQWRNLNQHKRAGTLFEEQSSTERGRLAIFCPACPQPGVNLPDDWEKDKDDWKYVPTVVGDGNFKQDHLKMKNPDEDVALSDGEGYMVGKKDFEEYLRLTEKVPDASTSASECNEYSAVKNQNKTKAHLDVTGIGAIACGRHGCFYPHSTVNFQKGEGYRYMDYAFLNAFNYLPLIVMWFLLYDIMCQYWPGFLPRINALHGIVSHIITFNDRLSFKRGIGLFHVHGHIKECYPRYAPTFIQGAGMLDGEIIETLWHTLNDTAGSARSMSWYHRQEYLDAHMGDSNWKKLIRIVPRLCRKWDACLIQTTDSQDYFAQLSLFVGNANVASWEQLEKKMQEKRGTDPKAMDSMEVREAQAPSRAELQREIVREGREEIGGLSAWISVGIKLEEQQMELSKQVRMLRSRPSYEEQVAIENKCRRLQTKIDSFVAQAVDFLGDVGPPPASAPTPSWFDAQDDSADTAATSQRSRTAGELAALAAEQITLPLPSAYGLRMCRGRLAPAARIEMRLREGQANDILHDLRVAIAQKSFIYRTQLRKNAPTTSFVTRLRSHDDAFTVQSTIGYAARVYSRCRRAMESLDAPERLLNRYQHLGPADIVASTAIIDPNARGQRNAGLSWIWQSIPSSETPAFMTEMLRVNWLRAKARRDRWAEEKILLRAEIQWTRNFFNHMRTKWYARATSGEPQLASYAYRQTDTWRRFTELADTALAKFGYMMLAINSHPPTSPSIVSMDSSHAVSRVPLASDLFHGSLNARAASNVAFRYFRIRAALETFVMGNQTDDCRRRRWRIGLYREVREFKRAIGELLTSGCTGGPFFQQSNFQWLDTNNPDEFVILWDKILPLPAMLPFATWVANSLSPEVANENWWWTYTSGTTRVDVTRPEWWDVTEGDMRRYFPEQMVSKAYLTECDSLTEMAAMMIHSMRQILEDRFNFR